MNIDTITFVVLAVGAVATAFLMMTRRNPMKSVLFLIAHFFVLAIIYLTLHAQFIAIIQILVYAGAIMVLFLFVIMLLNLGDESRLTEKVTGAKIVGSMLAIIIFAQIGVVITIAMPENRPALHEESMQIGTVSSIGMEMFSRYIFPFEVTSILLLAAIVGVVVLAKKKFQ